MPTTVVKSIGTNGRDYSTLQAWEDACPANLVTADQIWQGECYNDSEFASDITLSGPTTDATRYMILKCAAGHSFQDQAGVRTNPLRYDLSKGVGVQNTNAAASAVCVGTAYTRIQGLQVRDARDNKTALMVNQAPGAVVKDCFLEGTNHVYLSRGYLLNCVVVQLVSSKNGVVNDEMAYSTPDMVEGCTIVKPSDVTPGGIGFDNGWGVVLMRSCAIFGFTAAVGTGYGNGSFSASCCNSATNLASGLPGSNNQHSVTYSQTTPFVDADKDSFDLRAVAATTLAGNGYLDATNAPNDVSDTARAASPTIGAWELGSSQRTTAPMPMFFRA